MKHTCIIKPYKGTQGGRMVLDRIRYKDGHLYACLRSLKAVRRDQLKAGDEPIDISITPNGARPTYSFNFEDSGGDITNKDRMFLAELIPYYQLMYKEGFKNPNQGVATLFEYEDLAMNDKRNYRMEALTRSAKNKAWDMSYRKKIDAYYYYGENPVIQTEDGLTTIDHCQLTIRLCGDNVGVIMRRTPFANSGKTFLEHFVEDYKPEDELYVLKTTILKALILRNEDKPLLKKEGMAYVFGTDIIGSTIDECVAWLNNNVERKKFLIRMVNENDTVGADNLDEAILNPESEKTETILEDTKQEEAIRAEAKSMKIMNHWNMNLKDLVKEIEKYRPLWKDVKNMNLQGKVDSMKKPTLENIVKLVENEKQRLLEAV